MTVDGDIEAVFKHPKSKAKGASTSLLLTAIQNGGRKLDCYGSDLVSIYNKHGFEAVARIPWNPEYAPEGWTYGPKDVYVMKLRDGETADSIASGLNLKEAEGGFHRQTQEELDALPEFDDYDSALAYRDSLIQNTGNAEQRLPGLGDDLSGTAINPSVGAAGRGFSWGGEGVAGQEVPSQSNLIAYPWDEKVAAVYKQFGGTVAQTWMKYKMQVDTNGNDSISQAEAKVWLSHSNLSQAQKAWFWQNTNKRWEKRSNPFI